jgi:hypothetical protein
MSAAPPYWQVDIQKRLGTEYWTNVYHVASSSLASAQAFAQSLVTEVEVPLHTADVLFVSFSVRPFPGPSEGTITPLNVVGGQPAGDYLPLWNVARVDFPAPTGRPSRKFYRLPIKEGEQGSGVLTPAIVTAYQGILNNYFASPASAGLIDVDGQLLVSGTLKAAVGMRQLRRGSKRRLLPVIPL